MKIFIVIPVYNDWQSLIKLLEEINVFIETKKYSFSVIIINDASKEKLIIQKLIVDNFEKVKILNMKINKGHARCIATGLKYVFENEKFDYVIPMDGDGEDRPEEILSLLEKTREFSNAPIVGARVKRTEGFIFQSCYFIHKFLTFVLTGKKINFGNYTCLPYSTVEKLLNDKAIWSSFSGALAKVEKIKYSVPSVRGNRYFGPSKMSFPNLLIHSLSIMGVFLKNVFLRSFLFLTIYLFFIFSKISFITLLPVFFMILLFFILFFTSKREDFSELKNSLLNISEIQEIK